MAGQLEGPPLAPAEGLLARVDADQPAAGQSDRGVLGEQVTGRE